MNDVRDQSKPGFSILSIYAQFRDIHFRFVLSNVWFRTVRYTVRVLVCVASVVITSSFKLKLQIHFSRRNKILC